MRVLVACERESVDDPICLRYALGMDKRSYKAAWTEANREKVNAYSRKWRQANRDKQKAATAAWRAANPEKVAVMNKRAGAKWSAANPGKVAARVRKRQAAKLQRTPPWADHEKITAIYVEAARLSTETGIPHEVDHIYPLQGEFISGLHVETNLQILTRFENRSKGTRYEGVDIV